MVFVGIDWAEKHHDVCIIDQEGVILARGRVADGVEGILHGCLRHGLTYEESLAWPAEVPAAA